MHTEGIFSILVHWAGFFNLHTPHQGSAAGRGVDWGWGGRPDCQGSGWTGWAKSKTVALLLCGIYIFQYCNRFSRALFLCSYVLIEELGHSVAAFGYTWIRLIWLIRYRYRAQEPIVVLERMRLDDVDVDIDFCVWGILDHNILLVGWSILILCKQSLRIQLSNNTISECYLIFWDIRAEL